MGARPRGTSPGRRGFGGSDERVRRPGSLRPAEVSRDTAVEV